MFIINDVLFNERTSVGVFVYQLSRALIPLIPILQNVSIPIRMFQDSRQYYAFIMCFFFRTCTISKASQPASLNVSIYPSFGDVIIIGFIASVCTHTKPISSFICRVQRK